MRRRLLIIILAGLAGAELGASCPSPKGVDVCVDVLAAGACDAATCDGGRE